MHIYMRLLASLTLLLRVADVNAFSSTPALTPAHDEIPVPEPPTRRHVELGPDVTFPSHIDTNGNNLLWYAEALAYGKSLRCNKYPGFEPNLHLTWKANDADGDGHYSVAEALGHYHSLPAVVQDGLPACLGSDGNRRRLYDSDTVTSSAAVTAALAKVSAASLSSCSSLLCPTSVLLLLTIVCGASSWLSAGSRRRARDTARAPAVCLACTAVCVCLPGAAAAPNDAPLLDNLWLLPTHQWIVFFTFSLVTATLLFAQLFPGSQLAFHGRSSTTALDLGVGRCWLMVLVVTSFAEYTSGRDHQTGAAHAGIHRFDSTYIHAPFTGLPQWSRFEQWPDAVVLFATSDAEAHVFYFLALLVVLGVWPRASLVAMCIINAHVTVRFKYHSDRQYHSAYHLTPLMLIWAASPCADSFTVAHLWRRMRAIKGHAPIPPTKPARIYAITITCTLLILGTDYLTAGVPKAFCRRSLTWWWWSDTFRDVMHRQYFRLCQGVDCESDGLFPLRPLCLRPLLAILGAKDRDRSDEFFSIECLLGGEYLFPTLLQLDRYPLVCHLGAAGATAFECFFWLVALLGPSPMRATFICGAFFFHQLNVWLLGIPFSEIQATYLLCVPWTRLLAIFVPSTLDHVQAASTPVNVHESREASPLITDVGPVARATKRASGSVVVICFTLLWVIAEAFSGLILGNPSRISGPRSLRGGSYPFSGYPNFCYDWGARAYSDSGQYIGKPAHMRWEPLPRVLLRHVVVHYTDGHTTSLGLPFAMGSGLKSDKPIVQYALTGKREYMATTPKTKARLLQQMSGCSAWRQVVTHLRRRHQHVAWPAVAYVEFNIKNFSIMDGPLSEQVVSRLKPKQWYQVLVGMAPGALQKNMPQARQHACSSAGKNRIIRRSANVSWCTQQRAVLCYA